jgi:tetratricopeptide (TPR) repeat protein
MKTAKELHENAMSLYEESLAAKIKGKEKERISLLEKALKLEKEAAFLLKDRFDLEPTRSILFASCATMAYQLSDFRESEKMVANALAGDPQPLVLEELRDLFDKVNFYRHLTTNGIVLSDNEFRFTLGSGNEIMKGYARGDEVKTRIDGIEALYSRTVQRMNNKPYQGKGRISEGEAKIMQLYYATPQAASFAITFKVPEPKQASLFPEADSVQPYIDEMIQCIDLVNEGKIKELKNKIPDESYFQSFLINARKVAPDGSNVKTVGFTVYRNNEEMAHPFNKVQSEIVLAETTIEIKTEEKKKEKKREKIIVSGVLLASDSPKKAITVVEQVSQGFKKNGTPKKPRTKRHKITFVTEAQKELVRDHYEDDVSVQVWKYADGTLEFIDLKRT